MAHSGGGTTAAGGGSALDKTCGGPSDNVFVVLKWDYAGCESSCSDCVVVSCQGSKYFSANCYFSVLKSDYVGCDFKSTGAANYEIDCSKSCTQSQESCTLADGGATMRTRYSCPALPYVTVNTGVCADQWRHPRAL